MADPALERNLIREHDKSAWRRPGREASSLARNSVSVHSTSKKVLAMHQEGLSSRRIGRTVELSKNKVMDIIKRGGVQTSL
jgi:transposase-like protein